MDTALANGDFLLGPTGFPRRVSGQEELLQRATIRLRVPQGVFAYQPELGSRIHTLRPDTVDKEANALAMAQEALREMPQVQVKGVSCRGTVPMVVQIQLVWEDGGAEVEVICDGDI